LFFKPINHKERGEKGKGMRDKRWGEPSPFSVKCLLILSEAPFNPGKFFVFLIKMERKLLPHNVFPDGIIRRLGRNYKLQKSINWDKC
jgi:hypothetical protein